MSHLDALGIQARLVGGEHVATPGFQALGALIGGVEGDWCVLHAVGAKKVRNVEFGGGASLDADGRAIELLGAGHAQLVVDQKADAVVIGHAGKHQAHAGIARAGPGGVARDQVDFSRLQRGETLLGGQLGELHF